MSSPGSRDMAFANAGALHNPFVGGLNRARQFIVADDARGQIASAAENDRTQRRHEACSARRCRAVVARLQVARHRLADLGEQFVTNHVVTHVDRRRGTFGIGAAMAFDHDAVEPEKYATI